MLYWIVDQLHVCHTLYYHPLEFFFHFGRLTHIMTFFLYLFSYKSDWSFLACVHWIIDLCIHLYKTELNAVWPWHSDTKNENKISSTLKEITSERNKISLIRKHMTLSLFCLTIYKFFDQQSLLRIINRLIECCDRR